MEQSNCRDIPLVFMGVGCLDSLERLKSCDLSAEITYLLKKRSVDDMTSLFIKGQTTSNENDSSCIQSGNMIYSHDYIPVQHQFWSLASSHIMTDDLQSHWRDLAHFILCHRFQKEIFRNPSCHLVLISAACGLIQFEEIILWESRQWEMCVWQRKWDHQWRSVKKCC